MTDGYITQFAIPNELTSLDQWCVVFWQASGKACGADVLESFRNMFDEYLFRSLYAERFTGNLNAAGVPVQVSCIPNEDDEDPGLFHVSFEPCGYDLAFKESAERDAFYQLYFQCMELADKEATACHEIACENVSAFRFSDFMMRFLKHTDLAQWVNDPSLWDELQHILDRKKSLSTRFADPNLLPKLREIIGINDDGSSQYRDWPPIEPPPPPSSERRSTHTKDEGAAYIQLIDAMQRFAEQKPKGLTRSRIYDRISEDTGIPATSLQKWWQQPLKAFAESRDTDVQAAVARHVMLKRKLKTH
jgi:hypothetical protein